MKTKYILCLGFAAMVVAQIYVPLKMIAGHESVLSDGKMFLFKTQPIDPYDPFRGKYITLNFEADTFSVDSSNHSFDYSQTVYATLQERKDGFAAIKNLSATQPAEGYYIKARVNYVGTDEYRGTNIVYLDFPFERYFMEESKAKAAENAYRNVAMDSLRVCYAEVVVQNGASALKDVKIDGVSIKAYVGK